jgi:hypothetical protein
MTDEQHRFLDYLCDNGRAIMRQCGMGRCTCISSTRIVERCLAAMGIPSRPVACKYACSWPEQKRCHAVGATKDIEYARALNPTINAAPLPADWQPANSWDGHLVLMVAGELIDPSIDESLRILGLPDYPTIAQFPLGGREFDAFTKAVFTFQIDERYPVLEAQYVGIEDESWRNTIAWNDPDLDVIAEFINRRFQALKKGAIE